MEKSYRTSHEEKGLVSFYRGLSAYRILGVALDTAPEIRSSLKTIDFRVIFLACCWLNHFYVRSVSLGMNLCQPHVPVLILPWPSHGAGDICSCKISVPWLDV